MRVIDIENIVTNMKDDTRFVLRCEEVFHDKISAAAASILMNKSQKPLVCLTGPSGSGKSTIIKLLTGEIVPTSGQIAVNGFSLTNIAERQIPLLRRSVGVIFQDFRLIEKKTVYENLSFAMRAVGS